MRATLSPEKQELLLRSSQSLPSFSPPPPAHTVARIDPTAHNSRALKTDPNMLNNQAMRMRLGRDRDELDPREAAYLMHQMKVQGAVREKVAEESIRSQFNMKNMGNVDEVVFGRDMDGSGAVMGAGDDEIISRKAQSSIWNPNFRSEVAEITFGAPPPDSEAMATAALATRLEIPPTMSRADGSCKPVGGSNVGPARVLAPDPRTWDR
jgi:hypothetical protein